MFLCLRCWRPLNRLLHQAAVSGNRNLSARRRSLGRHGLHASFASATVHVGAAPSSHVGVSSPRSRSLYASSDTVFALSSGHGKCGELSACQGRAVRTLSLFVTEVRPMIAVQVARDLSCNFLRCGRDQNQRPPLPTGV